jgi:hypothetical protein
MVTLEQTLRETHDWAIDRIHTLVQIETYDALESVEDAHAIQSEFAEWLNPDIEDHDVYSLQYLGDS